MSYAKRNASFVDDGNYEDSADYDDDDIDVKEKSGRRAPRKSTKGRKLKRWDADEDQKLLLFIDYVCAEKGTPLPWDQIAATMEPRDPAKGEMPMTGEAIKQHLAKLREHRVKEGHDVPPKLDRTARRQVAGGKPNSLLTSRDGPAAAALALALGEGQGKVTVKKESTLLAPLSKSKMKKAEKALKAQLRNKASGMPEADEQVVNNTGDGVKAATGKRGRRPAAAKDEYHDRDAVTEPATKRKLRQPERKNYAKMAASTNVKAEPQSDGDDDYKDDDDLPLAKRRNTAHRFGGKKKPAVGLMDDTLQRWSNRDAETAIDDVAAESPDFERSNDQAGDNIGTARPQHQNVIVAHDLPQTIPTGVSTGADFPFNCGIDYQLPIYQNQAAQQTGDAAFNAHWSQVQSDYSIGGGFPGAQMPLPYDQMSQQPIYGDHLFVSSPRYHVLSSSTFPGSDFGLGLSADFAQPLTRDTSFESLGSNAYEFHDAFAGHGYNRPSAGLPFDNMRDPVLNNLATESYSSAITAGVHAVSQNLHYSGPASVATGLGISMPGSYGDNFVSATLAGADLPLPSSEFHNADFTRQMSSPMGLDCLDTPTPFGQDLLGMIEFGDGEKLNANLGHVSNNNVDERKMDTISSNSSKLRLGIQ